MSTIIDWHKLGEYEHILALSKNYIVTHEYETVYLRFNENPKRNIKIGDFYGDPDGAIIDPEEKFCIIVGEGLVLYWLKEPFEEYCRAGKTGQWEELFRSGKAEDTWFIDAIWFAYGKAEIRFVVDPWSKEEERRGVYKLEVAPLIFTKIPFD